MASTPCQSVAFDRLIAPWAAMIAAFFGAILEILTMADIVPITLPELGAYCRKAKPLPTAFDEGAYALARKFWLAFERIVMMDPCGKSETRETHDTGSKQQTCPHVKSRHAKADCEPYVCNGKTRG
jgi:hypothetical protein